MGTPVVDSQHSAMESLATRITHLYFSSEFNGLRDELEKIYRRTGNPKAAKQAFQDALYTLMVQEEVDLYKAKLLE
ncbi:MAG TPA: hypothetical protein VFF14_02025 [Candidatus Deferrimicrobium sp.]|jgi:hypothetical protein|nr:hypothetical protein [Candidatus Deferrimicrobium sp.]